MPDAISHLFSEEIKRLESNRKQQKQEDGYLLRMGSSHYTMDGCLCLMPPEVFQDNLAGRTQTDHEDKSRGTVYHLLCHCTFSSCLEQNCQDPVTVFWPLVMPQEVKAFSADLPPNLGYKLPSAQPRVVQAAQCLGQNCSSPAVPHMSSGILPPRGCSLHACRVTWCHCCQGVAASKAVQMLELQMLSEQKDFLHS